jgi:hypothetical protein
MYFNCDFLSSSSYTCAFELILDKNNGRVCSFFPKKKIEI